MDGNYTNGDSHIQGEIHSGITNSGITDSGRGSSSTGRAEIPQWQAPQPKSQVKDVFCNLLLVIFYSADRGSLVMLHDICQ